MPHRTILLVSSIGANGQDPQAFFARMPMNRFAEQFQRRVLAAIDREKMLAPGEPALAAISGGPDSTALLDVLAGAARQRRWNLHAFHVDHGLRAAESDADRLAARRLAQTLQIPFHAKRLQGLNPATVSEDQLRRARYDALEHEARRLKCQKIFLGHHANDLAETLLMRLARGAALEGLGCFGPVEARGGLLLLRPLIEFRRDEILRYLKARGLAWREDASNADPRFTRNVVRAQILPLLGQALNPRAAQALARTARLLKADADCLAAQAEQVLARRSRRQGETVALDVDGWAEIHQSIRTRVLRAICEAFAFAQGAACSVHLESLDRLALRGRSRSFAAMPGNLVAYRLRTALYFLKTREDGRPTREAIEKIIEQSRPPKPPSKKSVKKRLP